MNKDIRLLTTFPRHPKSIKLKRILGTWEPVIVLWLWAAENKPSGDLCGMENEDIAIAANWQDDPLLLIDALLKVRFLEKTDNGAYCLHGWKKHNAYAANSEKRSEKARMAAQARWNKRLGECSEDANECQENARSNAPTPTPTPSPNELSGKKSKKKKFIPPSLDDVISYFQENGYNIEIAKKAYKGYSVADWYDSSGKKIKNWKQKMHWVWFKPENKVIKMRDVG